MLRNNRTTPCLSKRQESETDRHSNECPFSVNYECCKGFTLKGPKRRTCYENGTWDKLEPECVAEKNAPRANTVVVVVPILLIFCIGIIVLVIYLKRSCKDPSNAEVSSVDSSADSSKNTPMKIDVILDYQQQLLKPSDVQAPTQESDSGNSLENSIETNIEETDPQKKKEPSQKQDISSKKQSLLCHQFILKENSPKLDTGQSHEFNHKRNTDLSDNSFPDLTCATTMENIYDEVFNAVDNHSVERYKPPAPRKNTKSSELDYADLDEIEVIRSLEKDQCFDLLRNKREDEYRRSTNSRESSNRVVSSRPLPEINEPLYIVMDNEIYCAL